MLGLGAHLLAAGLRLPMPAVVLVTGGYDHTLRFWEASSGQCYRALQFHGSVRAQGPSRMDPVP